MRLERARSCDDLNRDNNRLGRIDGQSYREQKTKITESSAACKMLGDCSPAIAYLLELQKAERNGNAEPVASLSSSSSSVESRVRRFWRNVSDITHVTLRNVAIAR